MRAAAYFVFALLLSANVSIADTSLFIPSGKNIETPRYAKTLCQKYDWACSRASDDVTPNEKLRIAKRINSKVNRKIVPMRDDEQYNLVDMWVLPVSGYGDCEDFVLQKKFDLIQKGFRPEQLMIAIVAHKPDENHVVLVVRTASGDWILDNLNNKVLPWKETGYSFIAMQNQKDPSQWVSVFAGGLFDKIP